MLKASEEVGPLAVNHILETSKERYLNQITDGQVI